MTSSAKTSSTQCARGGGACRTKWCRPIGQWPLPGGDVREVPPLPGGSLGRDARPGRVDVMAGGAGAAAGTEAVVVMVVVLGGWLTVAPGSAVAVVAVGAPAGVCAPGPELASGGRFGSSGSRAAGESGPPIAAISTSIR